MPDCLHPLALLTHPVPSTTGEYIYAVCRCTARRIVPRQVWDEEVARHQAPLPRAWPAEHRPSRVYTNAELLCCGQWWQLTSITWQCPRCERRYLVPTPEEVAVWRG